MTLTEKQSREKLYEIMLDLMDQYNFYTDTTINIVFSNRLTTTAGRISYGSTTTTIQLSVKLWKQFGWDRLVTTFKHEIAHLANRIMFNGTGHDKTFKKLCQTFGGTMSHVYAKGEFKDCATLAYIAPREFKYTYTCPTCDTVIRRRKRMSKKIRTSFRYYCLKCKTQMAYFSETKL